jgi:hypothetical protein
MAATPRRGEQRAANEGLRPATGGAPSAKRPRRSYGHLPPLPTVPAAMSMSSAWASTDSCARPCAPDERATKQTFPRANTFRPRRAARPSPAPPLADRSTPLA